MSLQHSRTTRRLIAPSCLIILLGTAQAPATVPIDPLPPPFYSFDLESPSVSSGIVPASAILEFDLPIPLIGFKSFEIGLVMADDDLDALSGNHAELPTDATFVILFSVDRHSSGLAIPDPTLLQLGLPYNATDQAARGHQAGDQFMSLALYTLGGDQIIPDQLTPNNLLVRNNYDEGGTDFAAVPRTSAYHIIRMQAQDRIDASADLPPSGDAFFSATATSPSLANLNITGTPSGADIFHVCLRCSRMSPPEFLGEGSGLRHQNVSLFASAAMLGLQVDDDIDAMMVFDYNTDGQFNGTDRVLFSLAPGSPTLNDGMGALSPSPAAHVFSIRPTGDPELFIPAEQLGMGTPGDNLDALELLICDDSSGCAVLHAIQEVECIADLNGDGLVNGADLAVLLGSWGPCASACASDLNGDGAVQADDLAKVLGDWGKCP